ncbi:MAG: Malonyl-CoA O-methyltransferase BioC [Candidatus Moranbacteria bacterium GW2011_GWE1_49_15]|nr:MAG: Malonyl-CoA O-methyltransferase BioC [Candidatus Moranbacteria bacterium GW2011_GWE1_49_15]HBP00594.1 hypothetical protein [Candidatus Moranbacteria bacterium]
MKTPERISSVEVFRREENPFEDERISQEWINNVEGEKNTARDKYIYPKLSGWIEESKPEVVVEIGAGQGICSDKLGNFKGRYIGIEPSAHLVKRAKELYVEENRKFILGDAYALPLESESTDASFSVNVWFHLENLEQASRELARILKPGGKLMIITSNPEAYDLWESWYSDAAKEGKKLTGKILTPVNPLTKNIFYQHALGEILESLEVNGLEIESTEEFADNSGYKSFICIKGIKRR